MAGSNPKITAEVVVDDHDAEGRLQRLADSSRRITKDANAALSENAIAAARGMGAAHEGFVAGARQSSAAYKAMMADLKLVGTEVAASMARAFADAAKKISHESVDVGEDVEKQLLKIRAFTSATKGDIDNILKSAGEQGASLPGGLRANIEAARAAAMSGVRPDSAGIAATHGQMFAYETGQDAATATEDLVSHASMLGHIKDQAGKVISVASATQAQLEKGLTETQNLLIAINKLAPGNLHDVYEGFKFGAPSNMSAKVSSGQLGAEYIQFAEKGIRGSEAGVAARAGIASLAAPTAKARMAAASIGVDIDKFRGIDYSKLETDNVLAGIAARIGKEKSEHLHRGVDAAIAALRSSGSGAKFDDTLVSLIQKSGAKTLTDHVKAANLERDVISPLVSKVDFPGFIAALNEAKAGIGAFNQIFGSKQGGKIIVLDGARMAKDAIELDKAERGDNYAKSIEEYRNSYLGRKQAAQGAKDVAEQKIFETEKPIREKVFGFQEAIAKLAADHPTLSAVGTEGIKYGAGAAAGVGGILMQLQMLKYIRGLQAAAPAVEAVAAPVAETIGSVAGGTAAGGAIAAKAAARGTAALVAETVASVAVPAAVAAAATAVVAKYKFGTLNEQNFRDTPENRARSQNIGALPGMDGDEGDAVPASRPILLPPLAKPPDAFAKYIAPPPAAAPIGGKDTTSVAGGAGLGAALEAFRTSFSAKSSEPTRVEGDVKGEASLMQTIKVEASPLLIATVQGAQNAIKMNLTGKLGQTMRGSNATMPSVAPGLSSFKPSVSGR